MHDVCRYYCHKWHMCVCVCVCVCVVTKIRMATKIGKIQV